MQDKKLSNINLNLINTLDVLLTEKSITKASKKLFVTQSAVSHSLKRLREIFEDELLVKKNSNNQMHLTPFAKHLSKDVRDLIQRIEKLFEMDRFSPKTSRRNINISTTGYILRLFLADLVKNINEAAPLMSLNIFTNTYGGSDNDTLFDNNIDIAFGIFYIRDNFTYSYTPLFEDELVCWADSNHDIFKQKDFSTEDYASYPHLIATYPKCAWASTVEFNNFKEKVLSRNIKNIVVNSLMEASHLLKDSNYLCLGCKKIGEYTSITRTDGISYRSMPFKLPKIRFSICHRIDDKDDKAIQWIITKTKELIHKKGII